MRRIELILRFVFCFKRSLLMDGSRPKLRRCNRLRASLLVRSCNHHQFMYVYCMYGCMSVCMYVRMCVCMYACIYVCNMYVCLYLCRHVCLMLGLNKVGRTHKERSTYNYV